MKGLILAGGKGTRLRPLTINTPKPIVPVANSPFLLYQVDLMRSGGIDEIILSLSYQPRKIEDLLRGAGFAQIRTETLDLDPPVVCVLAVNPGARTASRPGPP